jgi:hypothetical protein
LHQLKNLIQQYFLLECFFAIPESCLGILNRFDDQHNEKNDPSLRLAQVVDRQDALLYMGNGHRN